MLTSILLSPLAFAAEPTLVAPATPPKAGGAATLAFEETFPGSVWVDGCGPVELERREGDRWVLLGRSSCPASELPLEVKGELALTVTVPSPGEWRATVTWGTSCATGLPLVLAGCGRLGAATTAPFVVVP